MMEKLSRGVSTACRADIEQDDLGGGNWSGGQLVEAGRQVARVSYNGCVWEMAEQGAFRHQADQFRRGAAR